MANPNPHGRTFNSSVLIGNWFEDVKLTEESMKDFLDKKDNGQLLSQRFGKVVQEMMHPVKLSVSTDNLIHIGDTVMLVNPGTAPHNSFAPPGWQRQRSALGIAFTTADLLAYLQSPQDSAISNAAIQRPRGLVGWANRIDPIMLNTFVIRSVDGSATGAPLKFGQAFELEWLDPSLGQARVLFSDPSAFDSATKKTRHIAPFSVVREQGKASQAMQWMAQHADPQWRMEFEGMPVPANQPVLLTNLKSNQHLALEDAVNRTPLGIAYEASVQTYLDSHRAERDNNHWALVVGVPGDTAFADTANNGNASVRKN